MPQHTGCKQRSCSGKEEEEEEGEGFNNTAEEEERWARRRELLKLKERESRRRKGRFRMPGRPSTSLVCFAIHLGLFTASFGAAVDAPKTVTETVSSVKGEGEGGGEVTEQREGEGGGGRFPRSVSGSDYQDSLDYPNKLTAYGAEDSGSRSRRRFSESQWKSGDEGEWELAAQVAKRGQRGRGEYYRGPAEEEVRS